MADKKGERETVHVVVTPPTEITHTPEGSFASGDVLTSRSLERDELESVRGVLGGLGLHIEEGVGEESRKPEHGRTFGISNWRGSNWVPEYDRLKAEKSAKNN